MSTPEPSPYPSNEFDPEIGVPEDDPAIVTSWAHHGPADELRAYVARPSGAAVGGVLVIHENKGLDPYVRDVTRRLAKRGYVALAPDLLSRVGGTPSFAEPAAATAALGEVPVDQMVEDLVGWVSELAALQDDPSSKLGVIGFCFGGRTAWRLATRDDRFSAVVPLYGGNPPIEQFGTINAPVLAIYGALDEKVNAKIPAIEEAMAEHGKEFEKVIIPDAGHAFHNDSNPARYHPEAGRAAWLHATAWLDRFLRE